MKQTLLLAAVLLLAITSFGQDDCLNAIAVELETIYTVDVVDGDPIPEDCLGNVIPDHGEWYVYTPAENSLLTISTELEQNSGGDTRFQVYSGDCDNLMCAGGDDDSGEIGNGYLSISTMYVTAGTTYYIVFDDRWGAAGFDFILTEDIPDDNDVTFVNLGFGSGNVIVDMNGDTRDDIVNVNGNTITIYHQQEDGSLESTTITTSDPDFSPSWSTAAGDLDANGFTDLLYGGGSGVTFMMANDDGTAFTEISGPEYVFCQRSNMVDINNDGHLDAFVCHDVQPNVYYINDGEGNLTYYQGGLGDTPDGGNYGSVWIDYDNDHDMDLFIAKCRGGNPVTSTNQMHRNMGNGVYEEMAADINLADPVQTWSSAWGDYDNDGDMDVFVGASSTSAGGHRMMRNTGETFIDQTIGSGFDLTDATNIENCTQDFNNDGFLDILGAGGNLWLGNGDMTFTLIDANISNGPIGDVNGDGHLDVISGGQVRINIGNDNNYLRVHLQGVESNSDGIGARIECTSALGTQIRDVRAGEGFRYMSSITAHFGIADDEAIEQIVVHWPSGNMDVISDPQINTTLTVVEGGSSVGVEEYDNDEFMVYPSIAEDMINLRIDASLQLNGIMLLDALGKEIITLGANERIVDVSDLTPGQYFVRLVMDDSFTQRVFIKR